MRRSRIVAALLTFIFAFSAMSPASATPTKTFTSGYNMIYQVYGSTTFGVTKNNSVSVTINQNSGASTLYYVTIERQTCGTFGCSWKGNTQGGVCERTVSNTTPKTCNFTASISDRLHRVVLRKVNDGERVKGEISVK